MPKNPIVVVHNPLYYFSLLHPWLIIKLPRFYHVYACMHVCMHAPGFRRVPDQNTPVTKNMSNAICIHNKYLILEVLKYNRNTLESTPISIHCNILETTNRSTMLHTTDKRHSMSSGTQSTGQLKTLE